VRGFFIYTTVLASNLRPALPTHPSDARTDDGFLFTIPSRPECPTLSITNTTNKRATRCQRATRCPHRRDVYFSAPGIIKKMSNSRASQTRSYTLPVHFSDIMTQAVGVE
jgi:hypothetical protein